MFLFDSSRSTKIGQYVCHFVMFAGSVTLIVILSRNPFLFMWQEIYVALLFATVLGALLALGGIFLLARGYKYPRYRF